MEGLRIPVVCALDYRGSTRQVLYRYKDHRVPELAYALGPALAASLRFAAAHAGRNLEQTLITPLPSRRSSTRRRGFDATAHVARCAMKLTATAGIVHLLIDVRKEGAAKHGGVREREDKAVDAFRLRTPAVSPRLPVILVDDIVTTGATTKEAAETLLLSGVDVVAIATIAGTP